MKAKKICFLVVVLVLTSFLLVSIASATWYKCTIDRVGVGSAGYSVYLTDTAAVPAFTKKWFVLKADIGKELLAIALTAQVNGKIFWVNLPAITGGSIISDGFMLEE